MDRLRARRALGREHRLTKWKAMKRILSKSVCLDNLARAELCEGNLESCVGA